MFTYVYLQKEKFMIYIAQKMILEMENKKSIKIININKKIVIFILIFLYIISISCLIIYNDNNSYNKIVESDISFFETEKEKYEIEVYETYNDYTKAQKNCEYDIGTIGYKAICKVDEKKEKYRNALENAKKASENYLDSISVETRETRLFKILFSIFICISILFTLIYYYIISTEIVITDKVINGKTIFNKSFSISIDKISSISTMFFKGIIIETTSSKHIFFLIKNNKEIVDKISNLLKKN